MREQNRGGLTQSSSKGNQQKRRKDGNWYKEDTHNESLAECICCRYLKLLQFEYPLSIIEYIPYTLNTTRGCVSKDFSSMGLVSTFYRLLLRRHSRQYYHQFDEIPEQAFEVLIQELRQYNENVGYYVTELFMIDTLIRNSDRHTNNMALLANNDGYSFAPVFDNGEALFVDKSKRLSAIDCLNKYTTAKPFGLTYDDQLRMSMNYFPVRSELVSDVLDLTGLDFSIYDPEIVRRAIVVLQATTQRYLSVQLRVKI